MANTAFFIEKLLAGKLALLAEKYEIEVCAAPIGTYTLPYEFHEINLPRDIAVSDMSALLSCVRLLKEQKYDLVHTHSSKAGFIGRLACKFTGTKCVHTVHGLPFYEGQIDRQFALYRRLEKLASGWCLAIATQNRHDLEVLKQEGYKTPLFFEGNGVNLAELDKTSGDRAAARAIMNLSQDDIAVGCFARFEPIKDIITFIDAIEALNDDRVIAILGGTNLGASGGYAYEVGKRIAASKKRILTLGFCRDAPSLLCGCDIAALTSLKEGVPRILMEAMALGLPVCATDAIGTAELVDEGVTGLLTPVGDHKKLSQSIATLATDEKKRVEMGSAGATRVKEHFDERDVAKRIIEMYDAVL